ncbi:vacuolar amino acid transporter 1-like [Melia azedarach]|uniref:Vacuolar amino acid transporter 1-like n=1 Tax=Melia azedarach TaxID=155640 RepID=A0ACC1WZN3_MELAZ|nr:vacuolar amino acid transporter 1-like [Melia azedarach]
MKMQDEDLGPTRQDEMPTDDEENQADRIGEIDDDDDEDTGSGSSAPSTPSRRSSTGVDIQPTWPQSYRQSMDILSTVASPSIGFLKGASLQGISGSMSSLYKRNQGSYLESSLSRPLISDFGKEEVPPSPKIPAISNLSSRSKYSVTELPSASKCSFAQSVLNGINVLCGVGLLATPYAVREGGWSSLSLLLIFGGISCYTGILLKECLDSAPGLSTYPDIGQAAFGMTGRIIVAIVLYLELYAASIEYLIMMSDNLASMFPNTNIYLAGMHLDCHQIFSITATLVVLPTVWLRDLSLLSYVSIGGVITTFVVVVCLVWVGVVNQVGFHEKGTVLDLANLSVTIGIYGFCYAGHSVFPNIYSSMKEQSQFPTVLIISFLFCCLLNMLVAACGYMMFGDSVQSQFTLNFPKEFVASKVAIWTTVLIPMSKYAMTLTPIALSLEELLPSEQLQSYTVSIIIRTLIVISTLIVALTLPYFGIVMSLIGSLLAMLITLIFPCLCYVKILNGKLSTLKVTVCFVTIIVGIVCACVGTYSALARIATKI